MLASFADGKKAEAEREQIRSIMESLQGPDGNLDLAKLYQDVLLKRIDVASAYALGHLAKRYYSGGRQMETAVLKDAFQQLLGPAKNLQQQYIPQIQQRASTLDAGSIMNMVRGNPA